MLETLSFTGFCETKIYIPSSFRISYFLHFSANPFAQTVKSLSNVWRAMPVKFGSSAGESVFGARACENYLREILHVKDSQNPRKCFQGNLSSGLEIFSRVSYKWLRRCCLHWVCRALLTSISVWNTRWKVLWCLLLPTSNLNHLARPPVHCLKIIRLKTAQLFTSDCQLDNSYKIQTIRQIFLQIC